MVDRSRRLRERDTTARVMLAALVPAMFVIAQPDLGSGMVYMVIAFTLLFVAGTPWQHLAALVALVVRVARRSCSWRRPRRACTCSSPTRSNG